MTRYRILRDDGLSDTIAGQLFDSYDAAHAVLERYYGDLCCSDDRKYYRIEEEPVAQPSSCSSGAAAGWAPGLSSSTTPG